MMVGRGNQAREFADAHARIEVLVELCTPSVIDAECRPDMAAGLRFAAAILKSSDAEMANKLIEAAKNLETTT
ncbi:MAG: hypothetical protein AAB420_02340 [Patescibacteria group bacterium]